MKMVASLTTYNRPRLLTQSLPMIERECRIANVPLFVMDNGSTDPQTNQLLVEASERKLKVIRYESSIEVPHPRLTTSLMQSFLYTVNEFPDATHVVHFEDDIVLSLGALSYLRDLWSHIERDGINIGMMSGMRSIPSCVTKTSDDYLLTHHLRHPTVIYRRDVLDALLFCVFHEMDKRLFVGGVDTYVTKKLLPENFPGVYGATPVVSVTYHTGLVGVHTRGEHHNVGKFAGTLDGVIME